MSRQNPSTTTARQLGANWQPGKGTAFRVFTGHAAGGVDLLLFHGDGLEHDVLPLQPEDPEGRGPTVDWIGFHEQARPGDRYALRVHGRYNCREGFRHDPRKVLVDPAARLLDTSYRDGQAHYLHGEDNLAIAPRCVIADPDDFDWEGDQPLALRIDPSHLVFYEAPIRGATVKLDLPNARPGTYAAIGSEEFIGHLSSLHVTVLELYVAQQSLPGFGGDWNYNPLLWGAPDNRYATSPEDLLSICREFKAMVLALHKARIALCIDVVYNHTLEGNELGPTFSLKGLDNSCYRLCGSSDDPHSLEHYLNWSGCGNVVDFYHEGSRRLALETLRRWVLEYHVDMFRFDLAGAMFSNTSGFDPEHPLLVEIEADPVLSSTMLRIAEPWSAHDADRFRCRLPRGWSHWSARYRDTVRAFWLGRERTLGNFVGCITGGRDEYPPETHGWFPVVSTLFVHDGFNLKQWLLHNEKSNADGHGDNCSWNCGAEGPTDDPDVLATRWRLWKVAWASLAFSPLPLIRGGDEMLYYPGSAHNNLYAEGDDANGIAFDKDAPFLAFARGVMALRRRYAALGNLRGLSHREESVFTCYAPGGSPMRPESWQRELARCVTLYFPGSTEGGRPGADPCNLLLMINADTEPIPMLVPAAAREPNRRWVNVLHTAADDPFARCAVTDGIVELGPQSLSLLVSEPF